MWRLVLRKAPQVGIAFCYLLMSREYTVLSWADGTTFWMRYQTFPSPKTPTRWLLIYWLGIPWPEEKNGLTKIRLICWIRDKNLQLYCFLYRGKYLLYLIFYYESYFIKQLANLSYHGRWGDSKLCNLTLTMASYLHLYTWLFIVL